MAYVIKVDGSRENLGVKPSLKKLQEAVGGYIEMVIFPDRTYGYANEEGLLIGLQPNIVVSMMVNGMIVGDVVIMEAGDKDEF